MKKRITSNISFNTFYANALDLVVQNDSPDHTQNHFEVLIDEIWENKKCKNATMLSARCEQKMYKK